MRIIKKTLVIVFLQVSTTAFCQDNKKEIELKFNEYLNSMINKDFEKSMNYISDDFFKIVPKSQMILLLEKTFNNPDLEFKLREPKIIEIKDIELIDNKYYSLLKYSNKMDMKFLIKEKKEIEDEHKLRINLTKLSLVVGKTPYTTVSAKM